MKYNTILFATTNSAKVTRIANFLQKPELKILSLSDFDYSIVEPEENQDSPVKIAENKAKFYWKQLKDKYPVLTQDDTIQFDDVEKEDEPGLNIKEPIVRKYGKFSDQFAIKFYTNLAYKYGGQINMSFNYGHALYNGKELRSRSSKLTCRLVNTVSKQLIENYFLASIIKVQIDGEWKYYSELSDQELVKIDEPLSNSVKTLLEI